MASISDADQAALQRSWAALEPMIQGNAEEVLREAKEIFDEMGIVFFLRQGTCLGAIRGEGFIPWDEDLDLGSVIGLHGLVEKSIDLVVAAFRDRGFIAKAEQYDQYIYVPLLKSSIRIDWMCLRIFDGSVFHYPGSRFPVRLFTHLKEIEFAGSKFLVPDPPQEYLQFKYGPDWKIPKQTGYEKDIVKLIPEAPIPGRAGTLKQFLATRILRRCTGKLRVLDYDGEPVAGAEVAVAGLNLSKTNSRGYARFYLPCDDFYAITVRHDNHEEVLYEENMAPGKTYIYRPDPAAGLGRLFVLTQEE